MLDRETLMEQYVAFYEEHQRFPADAQEFTSFMGLEENEFLKSFNPLSTVAAYIWESYLDQALEEAQKDPAFEGYSCREVYLSLLYNLVGKLNEQAQMNRDMISFSKSLPSSPKELKLLKKSAEAFLEEMIKAGEASGEIASRSLVSYQYKKWCWWGMLFVVFFWKNDESEQTEQTDVAIEKTAHLIFDLLNPNAMDSSIQFFSFLFKQGFK